MRPLYSNIGSRVIFLTILATLDYVCTSTTAGGGDGQRGTERAEDKDNENEK